jgi:hypothetical protein
LIFEKIGWLIAVVQVIIPHITGVIDLIVLYQYPKNALDWLAAVGHKLIILSL